MLELFKLEKETGDEPEHLDSEIIKDPDNLDPEQIRQQHLRNTWNIAGEFISKKLKKQLSDQKKLDPFDSGDT